MISSSFFYLKYIISLADILNIHHKAFFYYKLTYVYIVLGNFNKVLDECRVLANIETTKNLLTIGLARIPDY